jgi:oligoribonuclease
MTDTISSTLFLWMDVETTGTDPKRDSILEIGLLFTDDQLNPLDEGFHSVIKTKRNFKPTDFIRGMHTPNGLLAECAAPDAPSREQADMAARAYIAPHIGERIIAAGSSVRFDRDFLDAFDPELLSPVYHRSLDVSTFYEATSAWRPGLAVQCPKPTTNHRVMNCLRDSIAYARFWQENL